MNDELVQLTQKLKTYLTDFKNDLDRLDVENSHDLNKQETNLRTIQSGAMSVLDSDFKAVWDVVKTFNKEDYRIFKHYFFSELSPLLLFPEINDYIYHKPLGYPGDFRIMNYIYDYGDKYLGGSSFEEFVNYYTCQVPICHGNRIRKEFVKNNILKVLQENASAKMIKITSIASGSAREVIELLAANKFDRPVELTLYDFEAKAFDYIVQELRKIPGEYQRNISIKYVLRDIKILLSGSEMTKLIEEQDFIYSIGIFDYLPGRIAIKLLITLYGLLNGHGRLMLCNASEKNSSHRAYYELMGDWNMLYRNEDDLVRWADKLNGPRKRYFERPDELNRYLYYFVEK